MNFILALLLTGSTTAFAQLVGDDDNYRVRETGGYRYTYAPEHEKLTDELIRKSFILKDIYEKEFQWQLDELPTYSFASSKNQIMNGFATQYPRLWTLFYNGGPAAIDRFATVSWADTLMIHESVHLYQLNARRGLSSTLKTIFGNPTPGFSFPTYMITPHYFTPTFILEGNATFNEGRFGNGGRLYSGYYRAMFLQLLKADKLTPARIINDHIHWPFGIEKYIVGGYFSSYLAEKFGPAQTNRYFFVHAAMYLWPFMMSDSFSTLFGQDFYSLYEDFKTEYKYLADKQRQLDEPVLVASHTQSAFTINGDVVAFMTSTSQGLDELCLFHKSKKKLKCENSKLPMGRVFRHNKEWVTAAYQKTHPTEIRAGLFSDGFRRIEEFDDRYIYAKKGTHLTYADAINSFDKVQVYKNGRFIDEMQSSPFMDREGNLYYFKQSGERRWLYKNGNQIFSIYGYYGRVVDVNSRGKIYFTGSTHSGVSLFSWDGSTYSQEVDSDLVYDAKLLTGRDVLVAEVTHNGIETKMTKLAVQDGAPVLYDYKYQNNQMLGALNSTSTPLTEATDYEYSPLLEIEYTGVTPEFTYIVPDGLVWNLNFEFSDPLLRYNSNLIIGDGGFETYTAQWLFTSLRNRMRWTFSALYDQKAVVFEPANRPEDAYVIGRYYENDFDFRFSYPFFSTPLWDSSMSFGFSHEFQRLIDEDELDIFVTAGNIDLSPLNAAILKYDISYGFQNSLDFEASRYAGLELGYKHEGIGSAWEDSTPVYTGKFKTQWDVLWQSYISASYEAAKAEGIRSAISLENDEIAVSFDPSDIYRLGSENISTSYFELRKVNAEYKQVIPVKQYFSVIPVGLHRVAPFYGYSEFYGSTVRDTAADTLFHEAYYGADFEVLVFHKFTSILRAVEIDSSLGLTRQEVSLNFQADF